MSTVALAARHCTHQVDALDDAACADLLGQLDGWSIEHARLERRFALRDYRQSIAFVNALAWMIERQDHHPELLVGYKECTVRFHTHSVNAGQGGLSINDFICAARADVLYAERAGA